MMRKTNEEKFHASCYDMRISFDLDDTLILKSVEGCDEPDLPSLKRSYIEERLRRGTKDLFLALSSRGCEIWIYSNSFRGKRELLQWFCECGIPVSDVVNQQMHEMKRGELGLHALRPIKFPPWFGIDLHIDDSMELVDDARQYGFRVEHIDPQDPDWTAAVLSAVHSLAEGSKE